MLLQGIPQRDGGTLVEQNSHLGRSQGALLRVLQNSADLFKSHPREPLDELRCQRTILEVLEQCCNRDPRAAKDPNSADAVWVAFDCGAGGPVNHRGDASTVASRRLTRLCKKPFLESLGSAWSRHGWHSHRVGLDFGSGLSGGGLLPVAPSYLA